ncbi:cytochrome d ubiquinol oxidase subunit II, partial [Arthrobacter sp. AL08]
LQFLEGKPWTWAAVIVAVVAAAAAWFLARRGSEGRAFMAMGAFLLLGSASIFGAVFPVVLPSTLDPAFDLTVSNASSSDYTLGLMSVVAAV